jgi:GNAT superfamily N-acetyltransferase
MMKGNMQFRKMNSADVPAAYVITLSTREKSFTREAMTAVGITEESVIEMMDVSRSHEGWVCEIDGNPVGFAMGNKNTGELWVIAVLPEFECKGIGSQLHDLTLDWLRSQGWKEAWLAVLQDIQVDAYRFFKNRNWIDDEMRGPFRVMKQILGDSLAP